MCWVIPISDILVDSLSGTFRYLERALPLGSLHSMRDISDTCFSYWKLSLFLNTRLCNTVRIFFLLCHHALETKQNKSFLFLPMKFLINIDIANACFMLAIATNFSNAAWCVLHGFWDFFLNIIDWFRMWLSVYVYSTWISFVSYVCRSPHNCYHFETGFLTKPEVCHFG